MAAPYTTVAVSGYNANPPADDGSSTAANTVYWATIKTKLPDPLKTAIESMNTNLIAGFAKVLGGAGVTSTATDYTIDGSSDQGKLVRATASGITITTPDATSVLSPWVCAVLNNSSASITVDGSGSQTIDGSASIILPAGGGTVLFTDGTNWFTTGIQGTLVGKQLMAGDIINGTIAESNGSNAVTFSLKTLAGADPSAADPVLLCFRNNTVGTGNYVYRTVAAALTLVIPSTATMGFTNGVAGKLWLVLFDDAGTIRLGAINCLSGTNIYPLGQNPVASSTTISTGADSAHTFYTNTGVTSKPYLILASASYESGLATAGSWNVSPTRLRLFTHGHPLPGVRVQEVGNFSSAVATGTTAIPNDDTIPTGAEGDQYMSQAITPTSATNVLAIEAHATLFNASSSQIGMALFQDNAGAGTAALACARYGQGTVPGTIPLRWRMKAGTTSSTTFTIRAGAGAGTTSFNGDAGTGRYGGTLASSIFIQEIMT